MTTQTVTTEAATLSTVKLTKTAEALAEVLTAEGVIGNYESEKHNVAEKSFFVRGLVSFATDDDIRSYHEVTYGSCVRIIAKVAIVDNEAVLTTVDAYDHPWENPAINYERLNARLHAILNGATA
jgi:hypothetical protein